MTTLTHASREWATRPADQRFDSLDALHAAVEHQRMAAVESLPVRIDSLSVRGVDQIHPEDDGLVLVGASGDTADFTHWSFGQISRLAGAPASYMRQLPARLAAECLNDGLARATSDTKLLFQRHDTLTCTAATGPDYKRIWNDDVTARLKIARDRYGFQEAPAAFDGSRGMYAGDQDMFCFFVDNNRRIFETAPGGGLSRGFFVWNSIVGAASFGLMTFLYEYVCGNHRVWGASGVSELRIPHIGTADERAMGALMGEVRKYADTTAAEDELRISHAMTMTLGDTKDEVLDKVFGLRLTGLSRSLIDRAYTLAESHSDWYGDPKTVWGLTGGLTEIARDLPNANDRTALDRLAGKVLSIAF